MDTIALLGALVYWLVILAALMVAFNSLDLAYVTDLIGRIVLFVPKRDGGARRSWSSAPTSRASSAARYRLLQNIGVSDAALLGRLSLTRSWCSSS